MTMIILVVPLRMTERMREFTHRQNRRKIQLWGKKVMNSV